MLRTRPKRGRSFWVKLAVAGFLGVFLILSSTGAAKADEVINPDALVAGKALRRAGDFLDWSLGLYTESGYQKEQVSGGQTLRDMWTFAFKLCIWLYLAIALVIGFSFILKLRWIDRWRRNLPWLIVSIIAAALSYVVLTFVMQLTANAMAVFMKDMKAEQLLNISFAYNEVTGLTNADIENLEIVRNTITLLKIATATAYAVGGVLLLRIIVLWMLTVVVPFIMPFTAFPITQSLGRIWVREFVRWLIVGPLIALFLYVSMSIWSSSDFQLNSANQNSTPYGDNVGTGTQFGIDSSQQATIKNNTGGATGGGLTTDTYSKYIISIIMLWVSILLPWLLMRFAITLINEATTKWYEKNRESSFVKQLEHIMRPPPAPRAPTGPAGSMLGLKEKSLLPARELHVAPAAARDISKSASRSETTSRSQTFAGTVEKLSEKQGELRNLSTINTLKLAGFTRVGETIEQLERSRENRRSISEISKLEQKPTVINDVIGELDKLKKPEETENTRERLRVQDLRNNLIVNEAKAEPGARAVMATVKNDTAHLATQSIKNEMREKTYSTIKENAERIIADHDITNTETVNQVKNLTNLITEYQQTTPAKQADKIDLGNQIDKMAQTVAGELEKALPGKHEAQAAAFRQGEAIAQAMTAGEKKKDERLAETGYTAARGGLAAGLSLGRSDPGRALIKSLHFLNTRELSYTSSDEGIGKLLAETPNLEEAVPDTEIVSDYEEARQEWLKYYRTAPVPVSQTVKDRNGWIQNQIASQQEALGKITSEDFNARREGLSQLSKIMPFLLMGDYSLTEVILYLKAKIAAAHQVAGESVSGSKTAEEGDTIELENQASIQSKPAQAALPEG